ncbi:MAG: homocysteine S-methyltransferase family protein [Eggerthellaceae bacterium]|nr:homocysteine S-methyltransferase family protein [Eggerthellaceae bacterium]
MSDLAMRFSTTMLTFSAPFRTGFDIRPETSSLESLSSKVLFEPEALEPQLRLELAAGADILVTPTLDMTPACLAHQRIEDAIEDVAQSAFDVLKLVTPQHVVVEIGPCGLPLDPTSTISREQTTQQYRSAIKACVPYVYDAIFLNGMRSYADMQCALQAARELSPLPIIASISLDEQGNFDNMPWHEARLCMHDADVWGFETGASITQICSLASATTSKFDRPLLVQLRASLLSEDEQRRLFLGERIEGKYFATPDMMADAIEPLQAAGVQFVRASGAATPAYTAALAALSAHRPVIKLKEVK